MNNTLPYYCFTGGIALASVLDAAAPLAYVVPAFLGWVGILMVLAGTVLGVWGEFSKPETAADFLRGPFRLSRHPVLLGMTLVLGGQAFLLGTISALVVPVCFVAAAQRWFIPRTESGHRHRFGLAFEDYRRRVPMWL